MNRKNSNTHSREQRIQPGIKPVLEILREDPHKISRVLCKSGRHDSGIGEIMALCSRHGRPLEIVTERELDALCQKGGGKTSHQGVAAFLADPAGSLETILEKTLTAPLPLALALDQIQDPGNVGTLCRTAWALGCGGVIMPAHNNAGPGPAAYRASAGALDKLPTAIVVNLARSLDKAEEMGFHIYGSCGENSSLAASGKHKMSVINVFEHEWNFPAIIVLGNEDKGIRPGVAKRCHFFLTIPFARKFDSLNIAQAGAIIIGACAARQGR